MLPSFEGLLLQSEHKFEIETNIGEFSRLAKGLNSFDVSLSEVIDSNSYLNGKGYAETDVVGAQLILAFAGHRSFGDRAQDFIFSKVMELGKGRKVLFRWTLPSGEVYHGLCTIANIVGPSGEANSKGEIGFELHFNGKPFYEEGYAVEILKFWDPEKKKPIYVTKETRLPVEGTMEFTGSYVRQSTQPRPAGKEGDSLVLWDTKKIFLHDGTDWREW